MLADLEYYAEYGEDKWLNENVEIPEQGVFVDVGAGDGISRSNTYAFEKAGWSGVCIEADPRVAEKLITTRKNCFIGAVHTYWGTTTFHLSTQDPALSRVDIDEISQHDQFKRVKMQCTTLGNIISLNYIHQIDLLSIDVEGLELEILNDLFTGLYRPRIIIVEYNTAGLPDNTEALISFFADKPYKLIHKTEANMIFKREEK